MKLLMLADLLVQLTIEKAKKEDKHPMEVIWEIEQLIERKRTMQRKAIEQAISNTLSDN